MTMIQYRPGQNVELTIRGMKIPNMRVMQTKYDGFCNATGEKIYKGDLIAFKGKQNVTDEMACAIWGSDSKGKPKKKYPITALLFDTAKLPSHSPNEFQRKLFDVFFGQGDNIICPALAGCTKTSSQVWICQLSAARGWTRIRRFISLAFNKTIETELSEELRGTGVPAKTTHSYGRGLLIKNGIVTRDHKPQNGTNVRKQLLELLCEELQVAPTAANIKTARKTDVYRQIASAICELIGYIKNWAILPELGKSGWQFDASQAKEIDGLIDKYNITWAVPPADKPSKVCERADVLKYAIATLYRTIPMVGDGALTECDFDDYLYLPLVLNLEQEKYDCIFTDETQDFCNAQIEMLRRMMALGGRVVVVGDENQAIYGFRGADSQAWSNVSAMIRATGKPFQVCELPLNYRCDDIIIRGAQTIVPGIKGASKARGTWGEVDLEQALERANNDGVDIQLNDGVNGQARSLGDRKKPCKFAFIGRVNSVLFTTAYMLFKMKKRCYILGFKEIGRPLFKLIDELCGEKDDPNYTARITDEMDGEDVVNPGLVSRLKSYMTQQSKRLQGEENEAALEACQQRVDCINVILENIHTDSVEDVKDEIKRLFQPSEEDADDAPIEIVSGHRCKGLEWDVVFVLKPDLFPFPKVEEGTEEMQQEINLKYVVYTRARNRIYNVVTWPSKDDKTIHERVRFIPPAVEGYEAYEAPEAPARRPAPAIPAASLPAEQETQAAMAAAESEEDWQETERHISDAMTEAANWEPGKDVQAPTGFVDDGKPF